MSKIEKFKAIAAANQALQERARQLNWRAGTALFPVFSHDQLKAWVTERLNGARSIEEVPNLETLRLPAINEVLAAEILRDNPETIEVLGRQIALEYRESGDPRVVLPEDVIDDLSFQQLPDDGIKLPNGRPVTVEVKLFWGQNLTSDTTLAALKEKCRLRINQELWDEVKHRLPLLAIPTTEGSEDVPEIVEFEYGKCKLSGAPLLAFGVVQCYGWHQSFRPHWTRDINEAQAARELSVSRLVTLRLEHAAEETRMAQQRVFDRARSDALGDEQRKRNGYKDTADSLLRELNGLLVLFRKQAALSKNMAAIEAQITAYRALNFGKSIAVIKWNEATEALLISSYQATVGNAGAFKEILDKFSEKLLELLEKLPESPELNQALDLTSKLELLLKQLLSKGNEDLDVYNGGRNLRAIHKIIWDVNESLRKL